MNELPEQSLPLYLAKLDRFIEACGDIGAIPVVCTFAVACDERNVSALDADTRLTALRFNPHLSLLGWARCTNQLNTVTVEHCRQQGVRVIDVAEGMSGQTQYFRDIVHFTPSGHKKVAEILANNLIALEVLD